MDFAATIVQVAREELTKKVRETSRNRGERVDVYTRDGGGLDPNTAPAWCASFASWCVLEAAKRCKICCPFKPGASIAKLIKRNPLLASSVPVVGGLWFRFDPETQQGHTGIVIAVHPDGSFTTIEGNTGPGAATAAKDREGDGVYQRVRQPKEATGGFLKIA